MNIDLSANYFELFALDAQFELDEASLVARFNELQKVLHPDKYVARPDSERRWSMQAASFVNQGYQTLSKALPRAAYLLQLNGIDIDDETDTKMDPAFLMEQMELREELEMAEHAQDPMDALATTKKQLKALVAEQSSAFANAVAADADWGQARVVARQWQFLDKLLLEVKSLEERLDV